MREHGLERPSAFFQSSQFYQLLLSFFSLSVVDHGLYIGSGRRGRRVLADIAAVDDEDDGVADGVVARPHGAQGVLAAHVPDLEVHVVEGDGGDVLADGRDGGFAGDGGVVVEGFDGGEEGRFAGVVEAEEEDRVLCRR